MPDVDPRRRSIPAHSCVVEACAGSGKTRQLAAHVAAPAGGCGAGFHPALTFTRKAAQEMRQRLGGVAGPAAALADDAALAFLAERGVAGDDARAALPLARTRAA